MQSKPLTMSTQVPPWGQGSDAHSSVSGRETGASTTSSRQEAGPKDAAALTYGAGGPGPARRTLALKARRDFVTRPPVGAGIGRAGVFG